MVLSPELVKVVVLRGIWLALLPALVAPIIAGAGARFITPKYKSTAEVMFQDGDEANLLLKDLTVPWKVKNRLPVIQSILRSKNALVKILRQSKAIGDTATADEIDDAVRSLKKRIAVFGRGGGVVQLAVTAPSAGSAHDTLQAVVDVFIDEMLRPQREGVEDSTRFLGDQLARLRTELGVLEEKITRYKTDNAGELPEVFKLNLDSHLAIRKGLTEAEVRLEGALRKKRLIEDRLKSYDPAMQDLEKSLVKARSSLDEALAVYTDVHPKVVSLKAKVAGLQARIRERHTTAATLDLRALEARARATIQVQQGTGAGDEAVAAQSTDLFTSELLSYKAVLSDIEGIRGEIELLESRLNLSEQKVKSHARNEINLTRLLRETDIKAGVYRSLLEKYEDALVTRELAIMDESNQVWVVDAPSYPLSPNGAPLWLILIGSVFGGFALGAAAVVVREVLSDRLRTAAEAESILGAEPLGYLPRLGERS